MHPVTGEVINPYSWNTSHSAFISITWPYLPLHFMLQNQVFIFKTLCAVNFIPRILYTVVLPEDMRVAKLAETCKTHQTPQNNFSLWRFISFHCIPYYYYNGMSTIKVMYPYASYSLSLSLSLSLLLVLTKIFIQHISIHLYDFIVKFLLCLKFSHHLYWSLHLLYCVYRITLYGQHVF